MKSSPKPALVFSPRLHVFGHIHEGYGTHRKGATLHVNASICTLAYEPANRPIVFDLESGYATLR